MPALALGDSSNAKIGDRIHILGFPDVVLSHELLNASAKVEASVTNGAISGFKQDVANQPVIQVDAPAAGGSSGGPAVGSDGAVLGVLTFGTLDTDQATNVHGIQFRDPGGRGPRVPERHRREARRGQPVQYRLARRSPGLLRRQLRPRREALRRGESTAAGSRRRAPHDGRSEESAASPLPVEADRRGRGGRRRRVRRRFPRHAPAGQPLSHLAVGGDAPHRGFTGRAASHPGRPRQSDVRQEPGEDPGCALFLTRRARDGRPHPSTWTRVARSSPTAPDPTKRRAPGWRCCSGRPAFET